MCVVVVLLVVMLGAVVCCISAGIHTKRFSACADHR